MPDTRKLLIINADDLGFSRGVNRAVFACHAEGVLTSATLAANMPCAAEAIAEAKRHPRLGVGLHLNAVRGRPLSGAAAVPELVDKNGLFFRKIKHHLRLQLSQSPQVLAQFEREYRAQIEFALGKGLRPTHFDSERHHAAWPCLFELMCRLAREYSVPAVRLTREPSWPGSRSSLAKRAGAAFLRLLSVPGKRIADRHGIKTCAWFYGGAHIGKVSEELLLSLARHLPAGAAELMTHPGFADGNLAPEAQSYLDSGREAEANALLSPRVKAAFAENGVELVSFAAL